MNPLLLVLLYAGLGWAVFYLLWRFLEHKYEATFVGFQDRWQLSVSFFHIRWTTERFNAFFTFLGRSLPTLWDGWFTLGVLFGFCACIGSVSLLVYNLIHMATKKPSEQMLLTPVIPGVNVPMHQLIAYFLALLLSGIWHEVGHAIAAVRERKSVLNFGIFLMFIYPGAFVEIREDFLSSTTPPRQQLKIICAGVWHNFTLALLALALVSVLPTLLFPLYIRTNGVLVSHLPKGSPFVGNVQLGDTIVSFNTHPVTSLKDWEDAFLAVHSQPKPTGWCADHGFLHDASSRSLDCCTEETNLQCFSVQAEQLPARNVCLSARALVTQATSVCSANMKCGGEGLTCTVPVLEAGEHIVKLQLANGSFLLFRGPLAQLWHSITVTELKPRTWLLPVSLPRHLETSLDYLFTISLALAILNLAPVYYLDGEWATRAFVALLMPLASEQRRHAILRWIFRGVTGLFAVNVALSLVLL